MTHDLVDLAVLFPADEFLVLIGQLDLHPHLVLTPVDEGDLVDDHHRGLDGIVRPVDGEGQIVEADFGAGVATDIGQHGADIGGGGGAETALRGVGHDDPPGRAIELSSLYTEKRKTALVEGQQIPGL